MYSDIMIGTSLATRYGTGFLEQVCVCGTVRMLPCGHGAGAPAARANSVSYVIVTHF